MPRDARITLLLEVFDQAFDRRAWHGTPFARALRGVSAREALWRAGPRRPNIWEIVLHAAYWKHAVRRRLTRDPALEFARRGANWPELPARLDASAWRADVALLAEEHRRLRAVIVKFPADRLRRRSGRSRWTNAQQLYGIASHDLYHAGQIQLLKRLMRT